MSILLTFLTMGLPVIDHNLQQVSTAIRDVHPAAISTITSIARSIGLIGALCVASYECWVMMLGRRTIDVFKILRIIGISMCITLSSTICTMVEAPGFRLEATTKALAESGNKLVENKEIRNAKLQKKYYDKIRALQDSIESAKRIQELGNDPSMLEKIAYSISNLGTTVENFAKRAAITAETKIAEWISLVIRFLGECIFQITYYGMLVMQAAFMKLLAMFCPLAFGLSLVPPWSSAWSQWISKYATISLWGFCTYFFVYIADVIVCVSLDNDYKGYLRLIGNATGSWSEIGTVGMQGLGSTCMYFVAMCVGALLLKSVPEACSWLIPGGASSSAASGAGSAITSGASAAAGAAMGAAGGVMAGAGMVSGAASSVANSAAGMKAAVGTNRASGMGVMKSVVSAVASQSSMGKSYTQGSINATKFNRARNTINSASKNASGDKGKSSADSGKSDKK